MAPPRKTVNGRSPLVNKQFQITSFFSKSPINPSSQNPKTDNPPITPKYGEEIINRRIKVYRALDKSWDECYVKAYDKSLGDHLVQYDNADEELIDLSVDKFEFIAENVGKKNKFKRLRKANMVVEGVNVAEKLKGKRVDANAMMWKEGVGESEDVEEKLKRRRDEKLCKQDDFIIKKTKNDGFVVADIQETKPTNVADSVNADNVKRFGIREETKMPFLGKERQDDKKRLPSDPHYDPRTLYLPPQFLKNLTSGQRQWWEFKSKHMDKVMFFKMGKFYELFEMDAHVGVEELDLQYMKGEQPHCGFPEKNFSVNVDKLARKGYRVLVIEQTETPGQLETRNLKEGSKDKVVRREICAIVTEGTLTDGELFTNVDASYIISVSEKLPICSDKKEELVYGICVVDVATSRVILGQIKDDVECSALCCLLSEIRPVEIIKPANKLSRETERALDRYTSKPLVTDLVPDVEFWGADKSVSVLKSFYNSGAEDYSCQLPDVIKELLTVGDDGCLALSAFGGILYYLKQAFLDQLLLRYAKFERLPCYGFRDVLPKPYMVLDATAMENLELFENSSKGDWSGTLFAYLNHCITASGRRLLKTWLARPLYSAGSIRERQDAVHGLRGNKLLALTFWDKLCKLPDMERLLARLFASSEANGRNANKIILYEDAAKKQLQEFILALRGCELITLACSSLGSILDKTASGLLHQLLVPGNGGLPDVSSTLKQFEDAFDWVEAYKSGRVIPQKGVDAEYDTSCKKIEEIESNLVKHIVEQRKVIGDKSINYATVGKDRYLLEVSESFSSSVPRDYELRSSKKGFSRYWSPYIKKLVGELAQAEAVKQSHLKGILQDLIERFCEHHSKWRRLVSVVAELDALVNLVIASDYFEGPSCRPTISTSSLNNDPLHLIAKSLGHPLIKCDYSAKATFVPNDIIIGGSDHSPFILLSGPNMGGKSTVIRQVCLAVILAQIGADVPAEYFELSLVDRIFVRMGAKDNIMSGHSTFLTELSETAAIVLFNTVKDEKSSQVNAQRTSATHHSLVALDELGRGTSTSDRQAIAEAVLDHLVRQVQCRGMFSTHYHRLTVNFKKDPKVSLCHMAFQVGEGNGGLEEVTFLYRLTPGACPKSYGVNVARLAGIPDCVLRKAVAKSREFEKVYGRHRKRRNKDIHRWEKDTAQFFQRLVEITSGTDLRGIVSDMSIESIRQLQQIARNILKQCRTSETMSNQLKSK